MPRGMPLARKGFRVPLSFDIRLAIFRPPQKRQERFIFDRPYFSRILHMPPIHPIPSFPSMSPCVQRSIFFHAMFPN